MPVIDSPSLDTKPQVLIYCQYVYGIGHYVRAVELARGLCRFFNVVLLNGGEAVPNYDLPPEVSCCQLPAIYKQEQADYLSPVDPALSWQECVEARSIIIDRLVCQLAPDILITEHFPFGLLFEFEAIPLITQVKQCNPKARIVSSVRDVIEAKDGGQQSTHSCSLLNQYYDMVLVHSDENIIPFSSSFPLEKKINIPVQYTGYVVRAIIPQTPKADPPQLLVSVGGGRLGEELLYAVLEAHRIVVKQWRYDLILFTGAFQKDIPKLNACAEKYHNLNVAINRFNQEHYRQVLASASAVICMGGYNSLLEAVTAQLPVLIYNRQFHGNNKEQDLRTALFQKFGLVRTLSPDNLCPEQMAARILALVKEPQIPVQSVQVNGAITARKILQSLLME
ncbi:hypothetical protein MNBD_GAMMA12-219 [hydrothermal vent metagenome]|uniref:Glycosyl transferase family 28 C-terminal domain-containing protein n=1 Tax=hydrothermal vent metagenome TaxID=652676 RepID=A0A3B0Y4K1_9ZZZZ